MSRDRDSSGSRRACAYCSRRQELKETNETYKFQMYRALAWTLGTFVTLFTFLAVALLTAQGSKQSWQWKWEWTQVVGWEVRRHHGVGGSSLSIRPVMKTQAFLCGVYDDAQPRRGTA